MPLLWSMEPALNFRFGKMILSILRPIHCRQWAYFSRSSSLSGHWLPNTAPHTLLINCCQVVQLHVLPFAVALIIIYIRRENAFAGKGLSRREVYTTMATQFTRWSVIFQGYRTIPYITKQTGCLTKIHVPYSMYDLYHQCNFFKTPCVDE